LKVEISIFANPRDAARGKRYPFTIDEIVRYFFKMHDIKPPKACIKEEKMNRQFSLARFPGPVHCAREHIDGAFGLVLDFDNKSDNVPHLTKDIIQETLKGYYYILHTTHCHMRQVENEAPREKWRAVLFFDKPVDCEQFKIIADHVIASFPYGKEQIDPSSSNPTWRWYLPSCTAETRNLAEVILGPGELIDATQLLAAEEKQKSKMDVETNALSISEYPPAACEASYNQVIHIVKDENKPLFTKADYKSYLSTDAEQMTLRERILNVLADPRMHPSKFGYEEWLKVGMAIKSSGLGIEVWDDWSSLDADKYKGSSDLRSRWKGFNGSVAAGSIFWMARHKGVEHHNGYKVVKRKDIRGRLQSVQVLDYHENPPLERRTFTSEDEADKDFAPIMTDKYFPEHLIDTAPDAIAAWTEYALGTAPVPNRTMAFASSFVPLAGLYHHRIIGPNRCSPNLYAVGLAKSGEGKDAGAICGEKFLAKMGVIQPEYSSQVPESAHGIGTQLLNSRGSAIYIWREFQIKFLDKTSAKNASPFMVAVKDSLLDLYSMTDASVAAYGAKLDSANSPLVHYPHLSVYGTAQPELFYKNYLTDAASGGFLARMLPIIDNKSFIPTKMHTNDPRDIPKEIMELGHKIVSIPKGLSDRDPTKFTPKLIPFEDEKLAKEAAQFQDEIRKQASTLEDRGELVAASIQRRIPHQALKISLICHEGEVISRKIYEWAKDVAYACADNIITNAIYDQGKSKHEDSFIKLFKAIQKLNHKHRDWVTLGQIGEASREMKQAERNGLLEDMERQGVLEVRTKQITGGRPCTVYRVPKHAKIRA
jgi:hypothetical protein